VPLKDLAWWNEARELSWLLNYLKEVGIWTVVSRRVEKMTRSSLMASVDLSKTNLLSRINRFSAPHISVPGEIEALEN
jgi:hypothetical protein